MSDNEGIGLREKRSNDIGLQIEARQRLLMTLQEMTSEARSCGFSVELANLLEGVSRQFRSDFERGCTVRPADSLIRQALPAPTLENVARPALRLVASQGLAV